MYNTEQNDDKRIRNQISENQRDFVQQTNIEQHIASIDNDYEEEVPE